MKKIHEINDDISDIDSLQQGIAKMDTALARLNVMCQDLEYQYSDFHKVSSLFLVVIVFFCL